ncbi:MAG TPA: ABC transporter permease [Vicinamibacterales bacterium]|nr:ABC transporter permease [Vicinamibacterales bacterium]
MRTTFRRLAALLRRGRLDEELREEMAQHVRWKTEGLMADGLPEAEARRRAAVAVGNVSRLREEARAMWGFPSVDSVIQDLRYGVRLLRKSPVFSVIAIASVAVGIGATASVFSLADAVLLRDMSVRDPATLVVIKWRSGPVFPFSSLNGHGEQNAQGLASTSFSRAAYLSFQRDASRYLDVLGFADLDRVNIGLDGRAELGTAHAVSGNYFDVLGVTPASGRGLGVPDDRLDAAPAAVISDRLWRRRFGAARDAIGRTLLINNAPFTVVGVAPASFHGTGQVGTDPDVFVPLTHHVRVMPNDDPLDDPNFWWVLIMGRLKPGVGTDETRAALDVLLKRTVAAAKPSLAAKDYPRVDLLPGAQGQAEERAGMRDPLFTMALVTIVVLLVACANVASLLLARGRARVRELSIRVAIGAPRRRVVRQLFTEALLIGLAGCALGVAAARWMSLALAPALTTGAELPDILVHIDLRVLSFALATACACAALFGVLPALRATDVTVGSGLQEAGRGAVHGSGRRMLSGALVVAQIALSLLLIAGAGLLVRTVRNLEHVDLGFDAANLLLFRIDPSLNGYGGVQTTDLYARVLDRLRATPGVVAASLSSQKLMSNSAAVGVVARPDETAPEPGSAGMQTFAKTHRGWSLTVDDQFFRTLGIRLTRGRTFVRSDEGGPPSVVVNRVLARQLFGTDDAVGRQLRFGSSKRSGAVMQIIGVVEDARYASVRDDKPPTMYVYYRHSPPMKNAATFEVRTAGAPSLLAAPVREIVHEIDPAIPVYGVMSQTDQIAMSLRQERLFARLATLLGSVAVGLSAIGLYGLLAYAVARRVPEIGLRMALGAARGAVLWMVLRESLVLASIGLIAGLPAALAGTRVLQSMLFGLAPGDPLTITAAALFMLVLAALAGYIPARRAARVDPLVALRTD